MTFGLAYHVVVTVVVVALLAGLLAAWIRPKKGRKQ